MYKVIYILDENWKGDLCRLSKNNHIWIIESEKNSTIIKEAWENEKRQYNEHYGVTSFELHNTIADTFYYFLDKIDEHHQGDFSEEAKWQEIEVIGIQSNSISKEEVKKVLEFESIELKKSENGFIIKRKPI